ncbi:MAG: hypothetical protein JSV62_07735 [Promethearchaeota archaeon]|nr:MAG: hypothetical protein JSV62_07735 [Candidatus Lokiarchaeota archaeon]
MSNRGLLIGAILSLIVAVIFNAMWILLFVMTMLLQAQDPGIHLSEESTVTFYIAIVIGIIALVLTIIFLILRAKKK